MKQVIVVNEALHLPRGKLAAQVAHAAVAAFLVAGAEAQREWLEVGMPKVVLRTQTETLLLAVHDRATEAGLPVALIHDAGRTVVPEGTITCVGIGPASSEAIDAITGSLHLVR